MPSRLKREVSEDDLNKFLQENAGLEFDGIWYFRPEHNVSRSLIWHKPVAAKEGDKFYLIEDN
jgi:hypothetical protein